MHQQNQRCNLSFFLSISIYGNKQKKIMKIDKKNSIDINNNIILMKLYFP